MKPTTFARITLFMHYLLLLGALAYLYFQNSDAAGDSFLFGVTFIWFFLAIFWILPYSILVLLLLLWSRGKTMKTIRTVYVLAPFALAFIALLTYAAVYLGSSLYNRDFVEGLGAFAFVSLISIPASLVFGYIFVGIALILFRLLTRVGFLEEQEAQEPDVRTLAIPTTYSPEEGPRL